MLNQRRKFWRGADRKFKLSLPSGAIRATGVDWNRFYCWGSQSHGIIIRRVPTVGKQRRNPASKTPLKTAQRTCCRSQQLLAKPSALRSNRAISLYARKLLIAHRKFDDSRR